MIFKVYFEECVPPQMSVTPPHTPSDDEGPGGGRGALYSEDNCEELLFLLYQLLQTYLIYQKGNFAFVIYVSVSKLALITKYTTKL